MTLNKTIRYQISVSREHNYQSDYSKTSLTLMTLQAIGEYSRELAFVMHLLHLLKGSGTNGRTCQAVKEYGH